VTGDLRWVASRPGFGNSPAGIVATPEAVMLTGGAEVERPDRGVGQFDLVTWAVDPATGEQSWLNAYDGPREKSSFDSAWYYRPIAASPDGKTVYVAGYSTSIHGAQVSSDFVTLSYDVATGANLWTSRYTGELHMNWLPALEVAPDGTTVYVVGGTRLNFTLAGARTAVLAYDAADGAQLWTSRHKDGRKTFPHAIALAADGRKLFAAGSISNLDSSTTDAFIAAYDTAPP
jgi:outer membrane protein assembly factor BamB